MNKKILYGIAVFVTVFAIAMLNMNFNKNAEGLSAISLANIEALATGEGTGGSHTLSCGPAGIKMCKATCGIHQVTLEVWGNGSPATFSCN
jgi:hypothetical protein